MTIEEVWRYYERDIALVKEKMQEILNGVSPLISKVGEHIVMGGGKRIRPLLAILCSRITGYSGEKSTHLACSIESIHTASLLHDDVVDCASMRRGRASANSIWGDQAAILVGDFLYSNALKLANSLQDLRIIDALSSATISMTESELLQLSKKGDPEISEEDYMRIIKGKTALLMSAACRSGALLGNISQKEEDALASFGLKLGLTFQMADDILDYTAEEEILGKGPGKDIEEGKITLPLIYLLRQASLNEIGRIRAIISAETLARSDLAYIIGLLNKYRCIEKSYERASQILKEAKAELDIFEDSIEKSALLVISDYSLRREK